jgi:acetyl esterase
MPVDPQVQDYLTKLAALEPVPMSAVSPAMMRAMMENETRTLGAPPPVARVVERTVPGRASSIPVRITYPDGNGPFPALVYFHGGGWVVGSIDTHDALCRTLTNAADVAVVSVDYRLAPEHCYPAALDDAFSAALWVAAEGATLGIDVRRIAVGGDSAGGNLAAAVALAARDRGGPRIAFQLLIYPITNDDLDTPSYQEYAVGYMLTREAMAWYWDQYVPDERDRGDPGVSPLRAPSLAGLPPALVVTAEYDVLRDEAEAYAGRLRESGVAARLVRYDGLIHGFLRRTGLFDRARVALDEIAAALCDALRVGPVPADFSLDTGIRPVSNEV